MAETGTNNVAIEIENITKTFGSKIAVNNLNLKIPRGEIFAFLGPNGAGKTTTIKMLAGLLRPDKGAMRIVGFNIITQAFDAKKHISYVPDQPYLYDKLSGREFLFFVGELYGISKEQCAAQIQSLAKIFETEEYIDQLTENYSHGMKQRIVISAALLHNPEILILDEPMVGLDPKSSRLVKDILRGLSKKGITIFMSTHVLSVAEELAHRIGIIHLGDVIALGTLNEIKTKVQSGEYKSHCVPDAENCKSLEDLFLLLTDDNPA